jgi:hypothetical protein
MIRKGQARKLRILILLINYQCKINKSNNKPSQIKLNSLMNNKILNGKNNQLLINKI